MPPPETRTPAGWRHQLHEVIFEADTPAGKAFDVLLILSIVGSVLAVVLESVASIRSEHGPLLYRVEWFFTALFGIEYVLRLLAVRRPLAYATSFYGIIDLLAILPTFASLLVPGSQSLLSIRILRLLRVFRVFKLSHYLGEANQLARALSASRRKIAVFLFTVLMLTVIVGSAMYVIEGEPGGFKDIPTSIYWTIVTMTTVGYGDIAPQTALGKSLASAVMILGYGIIAVPTGIVGVEMTRVARGVSGQACPACGVEGHDIDARFCRICGQRL
ncbi:MAG: ion transporter [Planctomycetota bacterium]